MEILLHDITDYQIGRGNDIRLQKPVTRMLLSHFNIVYVSSFLCHADAGRIILTSLAGQRY